ncbi:hypothetical protein ACUXST_000234 [Sphingomonas sp. F9_3S_D5_B_2]
MPGLVAYEISRRLYRWSVTNVRVAERFRKLQAHLNALPRQGVGPALKDLDQSLDSRLAPLRERDRELVIGDFDQDGGILPKFGEIAGVPTISPAEYLPRTGCSVRLVDLNGRLGVRKEFAANRGRFVQELEAMVQLEAGGCPTPQLMNVDWDAHTITSSFVPGVVVRELLALAGAAVRDKDVKDSDRQARDNARVRNGREFVPKVMSGEQVWSLAEGLNSIHAAGFVLEDVKFGNIILEAGTDRPVFLDLERALSLRSLPSGLAAYLRRIDVRKFREHFGHPVPGQPSRQ